MAKDKPIAGRMVQPKARKIDTNIVNPKGHNLAGPPRSGGLNPAKKPGKSFDTVRKITGSGHNR